MADQPQTEIIGTAMKLESKSAAVRASITMVSPDFRANSVLTAKEKSGSQEAVRVAARSEIPQNSIDSLKAQIKTAGVQTEFTGHVDRLKKFIEGGTLMPAEEKLLVDEIQKVINQYQPLRDALGHTPNIEAYAKWLLATQGGTLSPEIYQRLGELLKSQPPVSETDLQRLKGEVEKKEAEKKIVADEKRIAEEHRTKLTDDVDSFTTGAKKRELDKARTDLSSNTASLSNTDTDIASKKTELESLKTAKEAIEAKGFSTVPTEKDIDTQISAYNTEIVDLPTKYPSDPSIRAKEYTRLTSEIDRLNRERAFSRKYGGRDLTALTAEISKSEKEISDLKTKKKDLESEIGKVEKLEAEEKKVREEVQKAGKTFLEAEAKLAVCDVDVRTAESAYNDAKRQYEAWEKDLANKAGGIMGESAAAWINAEAQKLEQAYEAHFAELAKKEQEGPKRKLRNKVTELITDEKTKRVKGQRVSYRETSKSKVFTHAQTLLNEGPDKLIADFCAKAGITDAAEIAKMQADPALQNDIITEVLGRHMVVNGLLPQQVEQIERSDWGKDMVTKSLEKNDTIRAEIEKAFGAGALNSPSFLKKFWYTANKHPWLLLLVLGGVVAGGIAVGPLGAGLGFGMASAGVGAAAHATAVGAGASQMDTLEQLGM